VTGERLTLAGVERGAGGALQLRFGAAGIAAVCVSALYGATAVLLVRVLGLASPEAIARTAHLGSLLSGYEQTALAFGIERPPLVTLAALPTAAVPALREDGLAVALTTALLGGVAVPVASGLGRWAGLGTRAHVLYVSAFALHPLLLFAAAVGLPEALYACLILAALGQFVRWLDRESTSAVIIAGTTLGLAFLVRYNVLWIAAVMALGFYVVARGRGPQQERGERAQATMLAFITPVCFFAGLWAISAWFAHGDVLGFVRAASQLSAAAPDVALAAEMQRLSGDPNAVALWLGRWAAAFGGLSLMAIAAVTVLAVTGRQATTAWLAAALASVAIPETVALLSGRGQPHAPHLFALVVPAFVAFAYLHRQRTQGRRPGRYERHTRRLQTVTGAALVLTSAASAALLPLFPSSDAPADRVIARLTAMTAEPSRPGVDETANWIRTSPTGTVVTDIEQAAEVMLATGAFARFVTPADARAVTHAMQDPHASYVLVRRPVAGAAPGVVEQTYPGLFDRGGPELALAFEAGDYRIYRVEGETR
jgi:hypothetical protein